MLNQVRIEQDGLVWVVRVTGLRGEQVYACATEEMARNLSAVFERATAMRAAA